MPEKRKHEATKGDKKPRKVWQQDPAGQLTPFSPGIFITCVRGKEQIATKDALDLLNDYAERCGLKEQQSMQANDVDPEQQETDIEASIASELGTMHDTKPKKETLFTPLKTLTECVIFFRTAKMVDPVKVVHDICLEAHANPSQKSGGRFLRRMTPVAVSADSSLGGLQHCLEKILPAEFSGSPLKYKIDPTFRNHNVLNRDIVIPEVATAISGTGVHTVDLKNYDVLVLIEVIRGYLGVSVVRDWEKLRKYNLSEIYNSQVNE
ncbi:THUMP domain protein [Taphrina deformans PYCC 5710]|uniref:THUMP domain protein n=1 Tax=Taphrina deformans (strain PYCC 5710 / ATCC 11124 / CBS 356.35 / IMI 108563 / JCM 9778 / NBRC 8474) TaxID=1097556 RepID=R4X6H1_TAPDE|nr:THUMP domain protein [Taphrina deformans PYCC 5710]|eukprot:CCG80714.1 THUMP domain protein [Taphrina deformans PYCC 5710]